MRPLIAEHYIRNGGTHHSPERINLNEEKGTVTRYLAPAPPQPPRPARLRQLAPTAGGVGASVISDSADMRALCPPATHPSSSPSTRSAACRSPGASASATVLGYTCCAPWHLYRLRCRSTGAGWPVARRDAAPYL